MKCEICKKPTKETLIVEVVSRKLLGMDMPIVKKESLCHEHLMVEFSKRFAAFTEKLVIFHPGLEGKKNNYAYAFIPMDRMRETNKKLSLVEDAFKAINGNCSRCGYPAQVAFFDRNTLPRDNKGEIDIIKWNKPIGDQVQGKAEILCLKCAADAIMPSLVQFGQFSSGLCAPYRVEGIMVTLMV